MTGNQKSVATGQPIPTGTVANVALVSDVFVSSQFGGRTAQVEFVGLMEGTVGVLPSEPAVQDGPCRQPCNAAMDRARPVHQQQGHVAGEELGAASPAGLLEHPRHLGMNISQYTS